MTRLIAAAVLLSAAAVLSCSSIRQPSIELADLDEHELLKKADVIVVGTIKHINLESQRRKIRWPRQPGVETARFVRIQLEVEQIVRGGLKDTEIEVLYWAADVFTNASSLNLPFLGERAIHYLRSEEGKYRYLTDLVRSKTMVSSGSHKGLLKSGNEPDEAVLAKVLLTPGENMNVDAFARDLGTSTTRSLELVGYIGTLPLLEDLLKDPDPRVTWSACISLYSFIGRDSCIDRLESHLLANSRAQELQKLLHSRERGQAAFARSFLSNPMYATEQYAVLRGKAGILDFLHLIAKHPDKRLANRAMVELQRLQ